MEIVEKASVGIMPNESRHEKSKQCPSRVALRTRRECPCCKVTMMRHTLLYKHQCKGSPELKEKTLLERMDERIRRRMGPSGEVVLDCPQATPDSASLLPKVLIDCQILKFSGRRQCKTPVPARGDMRRSTRASVTGVSRWRLPLNLKIHHSNVTAG